MKILTLVGLLLSTLSFAQQPPSFKHKKSKAVFVDFQKVKYELDYHLDAAILFTKSTIKFKQTETGYPVFDMVDAPLQIKLDGEVVSQEEILTPGKETKVRILLKIAKAGAHKLEVWGKIEPKKLSDPLSYQKDTSFNDSGVLSSFRVGDLSDRNYLEKFLPTNYIYDSYKSSLHVFFNRANDQTLMVNATKSKSNKSGTKHKFKFPEHYNTSSMYYETFHPDVYDVQEGIYKTWDRHGKRRDIKIIAYVKKDAKVTAAEFIEMAKASLRSLEKSYGPWPHQDTVIIRGQDNGGGMEYVSATDTSLWALSHELNHSYFARGFYPADGDSGWLDEALVSWRDGDDETTHFAMGRWDEFTALPAFFVQTSMGKTSPYTRRTDYHAYTYGANFFAYINTYAWMHFNLSLKDYLRDVLLKDKMHKPVTNAYILRTMNEYFGIDFTEEFQVLVENAPLHTVDFKKVLGRLNSVVEYLYRDKTHEWAFGSPLTESTPMTPLHLAASGESQSALKYFSLRYDVNAKDQTGLTPLFYAVFESRTENVKSLLAQGADASITNINGAGLLHTLANNRLVYFTKAEHKLVEMAELLLKSNLPPKINESNSQGERPIYKALVNGHKELAKTFLKAGAKVHYKINSDTKTKMTIYEVAEKMNFEDVELKQLLKSANIK